MAKPNSKRKTRSDKFPLTLHPTGQFCKKIKGKLYYFGKDKKQAQERYLEQAAYLVLCKNQYLAQNLEFVFPFLVFCSLKTEY